MKFLRFFFLISLLLGLVSCLASEGAYRYLQFTPRVMEPLVVVPIWVDKNFTAADLKSLEGSVAEWNYVLNGHVRLEIVSEAFDMELEIIKEAQLREGWLVLKIDSNNPGVKENNWLAYCDQVSGHYMYIVRDRLKDNDIHQVALHEFGHLLGSEHVGHHLMFKYYTFGRYSCVDRQTAEEVAFHYNLSPDKLNYCVPVLTP